MAAKWISYMVSCVWYEPLQGKVVVIRGEGPKGGPGMPEMLTPTSAIMGAGLGKVCLILYLCLSMFVCLPSL